MKTTMKKGNVVFDVSKNTHLMASFEGQLGRQALER